MSWADVSLGDICDFVRGPFGGSLKKEIFKEDGYAVFEQQHAINNQFSEIRYFVDEAKFREMKRFELLPGELIMSCSGTMGKVAVAPEGIQQGIINQALLKISPKSLLNINFLMFWMESEDFQRQLKSVTSGAAIKNVASVSVLKELKILLPPLEEQKRIVAILNQADELRRKRQRAIDRLNQLGQSIFHEMFFSKVGVPQKAIGDFAEVKGGKRLPKGSDYASGLTAHPYIRVSDLDGLGIDMENLKYISKEVHQSVRRYTVREADVIISIAGTIGVTATVPVALDGANLTENAAKITPKRGNKFDPTYLAWALRTPESKSQILASTGQVTIGKLALFRIEKIVLPMPELNVQERFSSIVSAIELQHRAQMKAAASIEKLFSSIQYSAFQGEL